MTLDQIAADADEHGAIRRYLQLHRQGGLTVVCVSCGRCGALQSVHAQPGMRWIALVCAACHGRTMASLG